VTGRPRHLGVEVIAIAAAAISLVLTGCVPTREIPSGEMSDEDTQLVLERNMNWFWEELQLDDAKRPPDPTVEYIAPDQWATVLSQCMTDRGFDDYVESGGGLQLGNYLADEEESIAWYLCQSTYQSDPREFGGFNTSQLEYLYDYNRDILVPCLEGHGINVDTAPPRSQAARIDGDSVGWSPYYFLRSTFDPLNDAQDRRIYEACPPFPPGEPFDGFHIWSELG